MSARADLCGGAISDGRPYRDLTSRLPTKASDVNRIERSRNLSEIALITAGARQDSLLSHFLQSPFGVQSWTGVVGGIDDW